MSQDKTPTPAQPYTAAQLVTKLEAIDWGNDQAHYPVPMWLFDATVEFLKALPSETTLNNAAVAETPTEPCGVGSGERSPDAAPSHDIQHD